MNYMLAYKNESSTRLQDLYNTFTFYMTILKYLTQVGVKIWP